MKSTNELAKYEEKSIPDFRDPTLYCRRLDKLRYILSTLVYSGTIYNFYFIRLTVSRAVKCRQVSQEN